MMSGEVLGYENRPTELWRQEGNHRGFRGGEKHQESHLPRLR